MHLSTASEVYRAPCTPIATILDSKLKFVNVSMGNVENCSTSPVLSCIILAYVDASPGKKLPCLLMLALASSFGVASVLLSRSPFARCAPTRKAERTAGSDMPRAADHDETAPCQEAHQALKKPADVRQITAQAQGAKAVVVAKPSGKQCREAELQPGSPSTWQATAGASGEMMSGHIASQS